jgi:hypothetical protein
VKRIGRIPYTWPVLALLLLSVVVLSATGLGIVWMRQQIAQSAERTRGMERQRAEVERRLQEVEAEIASCYYPEFLEEQITRMGLQLGPPRDDQIIILAPARPKDEAALAYEEPVGFSLHNLFMGAAESHPR